MSLGAWVFMLIVAGVVWGGWVYFVSVAMRLDRRGELAKPVWIVMLEGRRQQAEISEASQEDRTQQIR